MRILICGSRNWMNYNKIFDIVKSLNPSVVIEGEAPGADTIARQVAEKLNVEVLKFPANWQKYKKAAGPIRNAQMLKEGDPDVVIACHNDLKNSRGTKDMVKRSLKNDAPVYLVNEYVSGMRRLSFDDLQGLENV